MVDDADKQRRVARSIMEMSLSVRETEKAVKRLAKNESEATERKEITPKIDANVKAAETKLRRRFSTQVAIIPDGKGTGGKISLEYYSESDLDRIFQIMMNEA